MKHSLKELLTLEQADEIVEIMRNQRTQMERCEAIKRYLLPLAHTWPPGVTVDDVAYCIISRAENKNNGVHPHN